MRGRRGRGRAGLSAPSAVLGAGVVLAGVLAAGLTLPLAASATPVCAGPAYLAPPPCPRVFQEPAASTNWVQFGPDALGRSEFVDGTRELQALHPRYVRIRKLADILHDPMAVSVGVDGKPPWDPGDTGDGLPLYVVEVTDFTVPDAGKAYTMVTAVHSAEPCGREAMVRSPEDLALAAESGASLDNGVVPGSPTTSVKVADLLRREKLFLLYNSPDGWRSGDTDPPHMLAEEQSNSRPSAQSQYAGIRFTYSEENGRGLNTNRMAPALGWNFRQPPPYPQPGQNPVMTEPEGIASYNYIRHLVREHGRPLDGYLDIHGGYPGAQVFSADAVANPRQNNLALELVLRISASMNRSLNDKLGGLDAAGLLNANAPSSLLQWTSTGTSFDTINYTVSGDEMSWISQTGTVSALIENNCQPGINAVWSPVTQQVFVDTARAGIDTLAVQTVVAESAHPRFDPHGNVGYVANPDVLADARNPSPPPPAFPANPYFPHGFTQAPYRVSSMDAMADYSRYSTRPFRALGAADVAAGDHIRGLDSLVIAGHPMPADPSGAAVDRRAYFASLRHFAEAGGNLVLTDGAIGALVEMGILHPADLMVGTGYVGYIDIQDRNTDFTRNRSSAERQTYDPVSLGYQIRIERDGHWSGQPESGSRNMAPIWLVARAAWEAAGGKTIATSDPLGSPTATRDEGTATDKVSLGTLALGKGRVVFAGALLPDPTDRYPHWFGLAGYGPTALGHHILETALTWGHGAAAVPPLTGSVEVANLPVTAPAVPGIGPALLAAAVVVGARLGLRRRTRRRQRVP